MYRQFYFKPATLPLTKMTLKDKYVHSKLDTFVSFPMLVLKIAWLPAKIKDAIVK